MFVTVAAHTAVASLIPEGMARHFLVSALDWTLSAQMCLPWACEGTEGLETG